MPENVRGVPNYPLNTFLRAAAFCSRYYHQTITETLIVGTIMQHNTLKLGGNLRKAL